MRSEMDLSAFFGAYREDGWGRAAFDPQMMVALLLYGYAVGERSSRGIERRCREDIAFRVITANQIPDHATIARFRARHEQALADTFVQVLALRTRIDVAFPRPVLLRIWETSGGNPFFALELARALQRRGRSPVPGEELPLPPSLEELVQERLDSLSAPARQVVRAVAALTEPTVTLVEAAMGREADLGLADALEAGVLQADGDRLRLTVSTERTTVPRSPPCSQRHIPTALSH
jgi:Transposase domain (DUF772)